MRGRPLTGHTLDLGDDQLTYVDDGGTFYVLHPDLHYHCQDGTQHFYMRDGDGDLIFHRTDGPAVIWTSGAREWYLFGEPYSFDKWLALLPKTDEEKVMLKLILA